MLPKHKQPSLEAGLLIILLVIGIVALGLFSEKPELVPEEGEMFGLGLYMFMQRGEDG